jgi:hypothetical protein
VYIVENMHPKVYPTFLKLAYNFVFGSIDPPTGEVNIPREDSSVSHSVLLLCARFTEISGNYILKIVSSRHVHNFGSGEKSILELSWEEIDRPSTSFCGFERFFFTVLHFVSFCFST